MRHPQLRARSAVVCDFGSLPRATVRLAEPPDSRPGLTAHAIEGINVRRSLNAGEVTISSEDRQARPRRISQVQEQNIIDHTDKQRQVNRCSSPMTSLYFCARTFPAPPCILRAEW